MEAPIPNKRLRQNPNSLPNVPDFNQNHVDEIISSFLSLPDLPSLSSPLSIGVSFDRVLDKLFEASGDDSDEDRLNDRTLQLASLLQDSTERCYRKRATLSNSNSWPLPQELTIKVFSMLDTKSLMQAAACCTLFNKYAMEPLCYSHIDLTTAFEHVDDGVVSTVIHRAGKELRSLKLGCMARVDVTSSYRAGGCLGPLFSNQGFSGNLLRSLHLYNRVWFHNEPLCSVLPACSNLIDLKIVGLNIDPLDEIVKLIPRKCEHLFIESLPRLVTTSLLYVTSFGIDCPNITSLSLIGFEINDSNAYLLIKGFRKLKYLNLSSTHGIDGSFLREAGHGCRDTLLETLILRTCFFLEKITVLMFLDSLLKGQFRFIRHIDVSSIYGLISGGRRSWKPKFNLKELKEKRPGLTFMAEFTPPPTLPPPSYSSPPASPSPSYWSGSSSSPSSSGYVYSSSGSDEEEDYYN